MFSRRKPRFWMNILITCLRDMEQTGSGFPPNFPFIFFKLYFLYLETIPSSYPASEDIREPPRNRIAELIERKRARLVKIAKRRGKRLRRLNESAVNRSLENARRIVRLSQNSRLVYIVIGILSLSPPSHPALTHLTYNLVHKPPSSSTLEINVT